MLGGKLKNWTKFKETVSRQISGLELNRTRSPELKVVSEGEPPAEEAAPVKARGPEKEPEKSVPDLPRSYPFTTVLSIAPLYEYWRGLKDEETDPYQRSLRQTLLEPFGISPRLMSPMNDFDFLREYPGLIEGLTMPFIARDVWESEAVAICAPYRPELAWGSPDFIRLFGEGVAFRGPSGSAEGIWYQQLIYQTWEFILRRLYDLNPGGEPHPLILSPAPGDGGFQQHFELRTDTRFCLPQKPARLPRLSDKDKKDIEAGRLDFNRLMNLLPPARFEIRGLMILRCREVTEEQALAGMEKLLGTPDGLASRENLLALGQCFSSLLQTGTVRPGLLTIQGDRILYLDDDPERDMTHHKPEFYQPTEAEFRQTLHHDVIGKNAILQIGADVLSEREDRLSAALLRRGIRSLLLVPLSRDDKPVGVLELDCPEGFELSLDARAGLAKAARLFAADIERDTREFQNSIQSVILEKYTAIHPSVEWVFRDAALDYVNQRMQDGMAELAPIVFRNVYPLYGASDIRGSSNKRNAAIQADLKDQTIAAKNVIELALKKKPMPILQEIRYRVDTQIKRLSEGLMAGDEITVLEFLRNEVETFFDALVDMVPEVEGRIKAYHDLINNEHGVFYNARKKYDDSVTLLNEAIAAYYEEEQEKFQEFFPHYFEKQSTDGVDHTIYIGQSLVKDREFHHLYMHNVRLWQLMVMCGAAWVAENLKASLPVPLDLTHLIVVQATTLAIRFSNDEKQFEVDGAYNIRYEIMKKRIDKAIVKGTGERLTQPGKLAIVYSQKKERADYQKYVQYLQNDGYFLEEVEELEIDDLQGVHGLRALRVGINLRSMPNQSSEKSGNLSNVVQNSRRWLLNKRKEMEEKASLLSEFKRRGADGVEVSEVGEDAAPDEEDDSRKEA